MRDCSIQKGLRIVEADMAAWRALAEFHYRGHHPGAVDRIFALVWDSRRADERPGRLLCDPGRPVGVIVYAMPVQNCALRNRATNGRFVGLGDKPFTMRALNAELRSISRVVIHPSYRGIGLAEWLVRQTLPKAGTAMVEAMAVMGRVNPFFERAGMRRYDGPLSAGAVRLLGAMEHLGLSPEQMVEPAVCADMLRSLEPELREWILHEMRRFAQTFGRYGRKLARRIFGPNDDELESLVRLVLAHVHSRPVYYLWVR
jgi:GNAT superfamily N-acetyltransferase